MWPSPQPLPPATQACALHGAAPAPADLCSVTCGHLLQVLPCTLQAVPRGRRAQAGRGPSCSLQPHGLPRDKSCIDGHPCASAALHILGAQDGALVLHALSAACAPTLDTAASGESDVLSWMPGIKQEGAGCSISCDADFMPCQGQAGPCVGAVPHMSGPQDANTILDAPPTA